MSIRLSLCLLLLVASACGDDDATLPDDDAGPTERVDAGPRDGGPPQCTFPSECSDGEFCNGPERCDPADPNADENGCLPAAEPACPDLFTCDEESASCRSPCDVSGDEDGDGFNSEACGGFDCDDGDPDVHPGAPERCNGMDDDCDGEIDEDCE
ncbi:MAG: putative metal-binding motif-containing protein [Myxococcales bacterium]|nr:putative metal-binding motif-containing protein [Myxococcales bacterium]